MQIQNNLRMVQTKTKSTENLTLWSVNLSGAQMPLGAFLFGLEVCWML